jgi:transcriptional regulator with XRE-family HTH domain
MATLNVRENVRGLGEYIREQRNTAQISLRQLARLAGVSNPYLSQIERGLRRPSAEILQQIAKALRISAEALYVQAGILEERPSDSDVPVAILADPMITERQKQVLLEIYESFRRENAEPPSAAVPTVAASSRAASTPASSRAASTPAPSRAASTPAPSRAASTSAPSRTAGPPAPSRAASTSARTGTRKPATGPAAPGRRRAASSRGASSGQRAARPAGAGTAGTARPHPATDLRPAAGDPPEASHPRRSD